MDKPRPAWPSMKKVLGDARTLRQLFALDSAVLSRAAGAAERDLKRDGVTEAYARALAEAEGVTEAPCSLLDSARAFLYTAPAMVAYARCREQTAAASGRPENRDSDFSWFKQYPQVFLDEPREALEDLGALPVPLPDEGPGVPGAALAPTDDDRDLTFFPLRQSPGWVLQEERASAALRDGTWTAAAAVGWLAEWAEALSDAAGLANDSAYDLMGWPENALYHHLMLAAWDLPRHAEAYRKVATLEFVHEMPPQWYLGVGAVQWMIEASRYREALEVLSWLSPEAYSFDEPPWPLPVTADPDPDLVSALNHFGFHPDMNTRRFWAATARARALAELGQFEDAMVALDGSDKWAAAIADRDLLSDWERVVAYLRGYRAGQARAAARPDPEFDRKLDAILDSQQRMERLALESRSREMHMEQNLGTVGDEVGALIEVMTDLPGLISAQVRRDWQANEEFRVGRDALLRGWQKLRRAEDQEALRNAVKEAVGAKAFDLLHKDSLDDLLGAQIIKDTWGRQYLALAATGLCRAFERELRLALENRSGDWAPGHWERATWEQLLRVPERRPEGDRLRRVAARAVEADLKRIRDRAMHADPSGLSSDQFRKLESVLFRDGLDGQGLLGLTVMFGR